MAVLTELKMDPKIVHLRSSRKGWKTRQNHEVFLVNLLKFQQKVVDFQVLNA